MKKHFRTILIIVVGLISINGLVFGVTSLFQSSVAGVDDLQVRVAFRTSAAIALIPKILIAVTGLVSAYFYFRDRKLLNLLLGIWFGLQCLNLSIRLFTPDRTGYHERILFDASTLQWGFGLGWWLNEPENTRMLWVSMNFLFVGLGILFLILRQTNDRDFTNNRSEPNGANQ